MPPRKPRPPLTKARQAEGGTFKGTPLNPPLSTEARYRNDLERMIAQMRGETEREMRRLHATFGTMDAAQGWGLDAPSLASQARILTNALALKFQAAFARRARGLADQLARNVEGNSKTNLHASLKELSGGISLRTSVVTPRLREAVKATIAENVGLIKSIPQEYFQRIQGAVMRNITAGRGTAGILDTIERIGAVTTRRAALIARDQTSKATTAVNSARMSALGIRKFEWLHSSGGKEPRPLHVELSGQVFSLDDPPVIDDKTGERGLPGQLINCRCRMVPVVDFGSEDE